MFNPTYQPPYQRLAQMEQQYPQTIQTYQTPQPQVLCYFVDSSAAMQSMQIMPNIVYIGINRATKEIYTKQLNNDGMIESEAYKLSGGRQEETENKAILAKLEAIEKRLGANNEPNVTNANAANDERQSAEQPNDASV